MYRVLTAAAASALLLLTGCSASRPDAHPSVTFGTDASGMPGMTGMSPMPSASAGAATAPAGGQEVGIDNFAFAPASLTVHVGNTVTWTNHDEEPHTVVANDGSFHSPGLGTGATYSHTFSAAGTFDYICSIHPMMHGTVVVTP